MLNIFALGGGPTDLERAFEDGADIQMPIPVQDSEVVDSLQTATGFRARMGDLDQYPNFLAFFQEKITHHGWIPVVQEYVFSKTPNAETMFANLLEGLYHPLIHLGLGVEFKQPSIVAEGLAQAASHDSMGIENFFVQAEARSKEMSLPQQSLVKLLATVRANEDLRNAPEAFTDGPTRVREAILKSGNLEQIVDIAAQFRVKPEDLELRLAETINSSAYTTGAAQRKGKARKIDFFHMHAVTASIALRVLSEQSWIDLADKARLVEWKGRLDLVWYAASAAVELCLEDITHYQPDRSAGWDWSTLFQAVLKVHDDGHLAKLVRALKHGEDYSKNLDVDDKERFPIRGDSWLKIAQIAYDSTAGRDIEEKWIWGVGFETFWSHVPDLESSPGARM